MRVQKSQAAIDLLISYSTAILIISISIYVILQLGVFNTRIAPTYCTASPGFSCDGAAMNISGEVLLIFAQSNGGTMSVTGAACSSIANSLTTGPEYGNVGVLPDSGSAASFYPANSLLQSGLSVYPSNETKFIVNCYNGAGIAKGHIGNSFSGIIWVNYTYSGLPSNYHVVQQVATFSERYSALGTLGVTTTTSTSTSSTTTT